VLFFKKKKNKQENNKNFQKIYQRGQAWWVIPIIPALGRQEARGSRVQGQLVLYRQTLSQNKNAHKKIQPNATYLFFSFFFFFFWLL
jgi:hypothetical protein